MSAIRPEELRSQPPLLYPPYKSTLRRAPSQPLVRVPGSLSDLNTPVYGHFPVRPTDNDLTLQYPDQPQGERIVVAGRVVDEDGRPVRDALAELWQTNAAGRYRHAKDVQPGPLYPNLGGVLRFIN